MEAGAGEGKTGILLRAGHPDHALEELARALDSLLTAGTDMERVALDPRWIPDAPPLDLHLRFGRPLVCVTDDPVIAVLARQGGARIFLTSAPHAIQRGLSFVSREP
jgi:hypothetical protein